MSVVLNLSHADYLNLPVTLDSKLWATKNRKGPSYFCNFCNFFAILANKIWNYVLTSTIPSGGSFRSVNIKPF